MAGSVMPALVAGIHAKTFREGLPTGHHTGTWMAVTNAAMTVKQR